MSNRNSTKISFQINKIRWNVYIPNQNQIGHPVYLARMLAAIWLDTTKYPNPSTRSTSSSWLPNTSILLFSPLCRNLHIFGGCSVLEDRVCNPTGVIGFGLIQYSFALPPYILALFQPGRLRFRGTRSPFFFFLRSNALLN